MEWYLDDEFEPSPLFEKTFRCRPFSKYKNPSLETGDKIIMPPSSLSEIESLGLEYPLQFEIESNDGEAASHCGVLEFEAEEGWVYMPEWMMRNLTVEEGDIVVLRDVWLEQGSYMKLQPHATAFIELSDPKAVLENKLRYFSCMSQGDTFMIRHNERDFYIDVLEVRPGDAISLIETDCEVDFAPPLDYKEPEAQEDDEREIEKVDNNGEQKEVGKEFRPFTGKARRLDGKAVTVGSGGEGSGVMGDSSKAVVEKEKMDKKDGGKEEFKPFTGRSRVLGGPAF